MFSTCYGWGNSEFMSFGKEPAHIHSLPCAFAILPPAPFSDA